jgi:ZIP family zinc transporter
MAATETDLDAPTAQAAALRTGMGIAAGIGLHNFSEGLAIGQAAQGRRAGPGRAADRRVRPAQHDRRLRHRRPLAVARVRASWGWLGLAGLIGGGPTFLGTLVGTSFSSTYLFVGCLALAAGALLYVIGELLPIGRRLSWERTLWGLLAGFLLGLATELVLKVAGG